MENKNLIKSMAEGFCREGDCFIHTEMKNGKKPETVLCGDFLGIAWGISAEVNRLSELTHTTFEQTLGMIAMLYTDGYKDIRNALGKDKPFEFVPGADWQEEWKAEETKRIEREVKNKDVDIANLEKKIKSLESIIRSQRENIENIRKDADTRVMMANKQVRKVEHELRDLIERQKRET